MRRCDLTVWVVFLTLKGGEVLLWGRKVLQQRWLHLTVNCVIVNMLLFVRRIGAMLESNAECRIRFCKESDADSVALFLGEPSNCHSL